MITFRQAAILAAITAMLLGAGCGDNASQDETDATVGGVTGGTGSSEEATEEGEGSTQSLPKGQFVKRANAICAKAKAEIVESLSQLAGSQQAGDQQEQEELLTEATATILVPAIEWV